MCVFVCVSACWLTIHCRACTCVCLCVYDASLYVGHQGYCLVAQAESCCAPACSPSLSCLTTSVDSHRYARTRPVKRNATLLRQFEGPDGTEKGVYVFRFDC